MKICYLLTKLMLSVGGPLFWDTVYLSINKCLTQSAFCFHETVFLITTPTWSSPNNFLSSVL